MKRSIRRCVYVNVRKRCSKTDKLHKALPLQATCVAKLLFSPIYLRRKYICVHLFSCQVNHQVTPQAWLWVYEDFSSRGFMRSPPSYKDFAALPISAFTPSLTSGGTAKDIQLSPARSATHDLLVAAAGIRLPFLLCFCGFLFNATMECVHCCH